MTHRPTYPTAPTSPWTSSLRSHAHPAPHTTPHTVMPAVHPFHDPLSEHRLAMLERKEPTRRLVRDVIAIRRLRKLSQAALAEELGVSKRTWQEWEHACPRAWAEPCWSVGPASSRNGQEIRPNNAAKSLIRYFWEFISGLALTKSFWRY